MYAATAKEVAVAFFAIVLVASNAALAPTMGQDVPQMAQVIESMRGFKQRFTAAHEWLVEYAHNREYHYLPPGFRPNMSKTRVMNAYKGGRWYLMHEIETDRGPIRVEASWVDGVCAHRQGSLFSVLPDIHPVIFERCYYTNALFLNVHSDAKFHTEILRQVFGASPFAFFPNGLPESVERRLSDYQVSGSQERVDGDRCVVLRSKQDTIWIDLHHGGICRRRIEYFRSGKIGVEYKHEQLREVVEGLWLPQYQEVIRYNPDDAPAQMGGQVRYIEKNSLVKVQFQDVPDALFNIKPVYPGYVNDHIRGMIYKTQPKDAAADDLLKSAALEARRILEVKAQRRTWLVIALNVCAIAALLILIQIRRARKSKAVRASDNLSQGESVAFKD